MPGQQARYWIATISAQSHWIIPPIDGKLVYIKGQLEQGVGGFIHWQVILVFGSKVNAKTCKAYGGETCHIEPTRSDAALAYVWKEDTRIPGTQFEFGKLANKRNAPADWDQVWSNAKEGKIVDIPADIRIRCYNQLKRIEKDYQVAVPVDRIVRVYYGPTGTGKSHSAWQEAGPDAYPKDPRSKFWDSYQGQENVIIDEFRGAIDIGHLLRWCDKYPVLIENKGGGTVLRAKSIWITSNIHPRDWFPDLDELTRAALLRRLIITEFAIPYVIQ